MESLLFIIALVSFIYLIFTIIEFHYGFKQLKKLAHEPIIDPNKLPSVSIIFSALNEANHIEKTLISLINLDYPNFEVIAVNDRSTDATPEILDRLQKEYPHLRVHHIRRLPEGWFGKNHALHFASRFAKGEWLLFTDADVVMKKDTLKQSLSYALRHKIDHLTIYEHHLRNKFWLKILLLGTYITYSMAMKPWRIRHAWSKKSLGHGAFNLVNKKVYEECNGHRAIAMECLDDLKLGESIKKNGFRQDIVDGKDFIEREWYSSLKNMISGMEKNSFAYYNYKFFALFRDVIFAFTFYLWPFLGAILFTGAVRWLNIIDIGLTLYVAAFVAKQFRLQRYYALFYPVSVCILIYTIVNSVISIYTNKGVTWRGTLYPLKKLKHRNSFENEDRGSV